MKTQRTSRRGRVTRWGVAIALGLTVVMGCLAMLVLALPVQTWRTGRAPVEPLAFTISGPQIEPAERIWIDTDAACGAGPRVDPDDCFAIVLLMKLRSAHIAGVSTVFGNAPLAVTDSTTRNLLSRLGLEKIHGVNVYTGAAGPIDDSSTTSTIPATPASDALREALAKGPLTIVSLGPLTNIAAALEHIPHLRANVKALVTVMGRRPGHIFHPAEGAAGASLLGHGPAFRDFNFAKDKEAASRIVAMQLPMVLVPYDAGINLAIDAADLENLSRAGGVLAGTATSATGWLSYWKNNVGQSGFYPFDLAAAAYVQHPASFDCATVDVIMRRDDAVWTSWFYRPKALLVSPAKHSQQEAPSSALTRYCPTTRDGLKRTLLAELVGGQN